MAVSVQLRKDYERLVLSGVKRAVDDHGESLLGEEDQGALERLTAVGLATQQGHALVLRDPRESAIPLTAEAIETLSTLYTLWLRFDGSASTDDEILYGELGYWHHWWNVLQDGTDRLVSPLRMDLMLPEQGSFISQQWTHDLDPEIVDHVFSQRLVDIRVIVPPAAHGAAVEEIIDNALGYGVQIRVFPSSSEFSIYDGATAVVRDEQQPGDLERHRLTRRPAMVGPLVQLFETRWAAAVPWETFVRGGPGILHLLAQGWTDRRIAEALDTSPRTVSRRVAELMQAAGVQSRFELGMKYAQHELNSGPPRN